MAVAGKLERVIWVFGFDGVLSKIYFEVANIVQPLTEQLKKDAFGWTDATTMAFNDLKQAMINPPVLVLPNFHKQFMVEPML